ncbi:MAG: MmgE/PrpD family protein [Thermodesulfobacteriota bacterium]|nr:MmgE/PrpD family protein [Thermodesulfobacteriota bacterium]
MTAEKAGITQEIAEFIVSSRYEDFPLEILQVAKRCIIDGTGVILAGSTEPCVQIVRDYVLSTGGKQESTFLGKGKIKVPVRFAALVNGIAGHAMDWDDTAISKTPERGVLLHPTVPPLAAGLAMGEKLGVSGRDILTAFLVGFEVECKLAEAISPDHRMRGYHTSGTCGVFGAAVTISKLMRLSVEQVRSVLGMAASMAAGLDVNLGAMVKPLHVGRAAENGVICAQLATLGFEANLDALEGPKGFFQALGGGFDPGRIHGKLGHPLAIVEPGVSIKPYPCGVVGHSTMDAMRSLVAEHHINHEDVDHVNVTTGSNILPPKGPLKYKKAQTALEAKFSVPFQMASMIIRRKAGRMEFTDEFVQTPEVQEMMGRVETEVNPEFDAMGRNKYISVIEVRLKDGRIFKRQSAVELQGSPHNPLSPEELAEKFRDCVQRVLNSEQAEKLFQTIDQIEEVQDIRVLIDKACIL